jgi:hypothetical protein
MKLHHERTLVKIEKKILSNLANLSPGILIAARNYLVALDVCSEPLRESIGRVDPKLLQPGRERASIGTPDLLGSPINPNRLVQLMAPTDDVVVSYKHRLALIASKYLSQTWLDFERMSLDELKTLDCVISQGLENFKERAGMFFEYNGKIKLERVDIAGVFSTFIVSSVEEPVGRGKATVTCRRNSRNTKN